MTTLVRPQEGDDSDLEGLRSRVAELDIMVATNRLDAMRPPR